MASTKVNFQVSFIHSLMSYTAKKDIIKEFGGDFYSEFVSHSKFYLSQFLEDLPEIGNSVFSLNYNYGPCYFSWYQTLLDLKIDKETALVWIWRINEDFVSAFPAPLLHWFAKNMYLGGFRRKAAEAETKGKNGSLPAFDWRIEYQDINKNTFAIDIYECAMLKIAKKFGYLEMFPHICRMDYLFSHYFSNSFKRTKTLGDGDICCNCWYQFPGECEWAPEKGFADRK